MRSVEEIEEYLLKNDIAGRYHRHLIRKWLMDNFPDDKRFIFHIALFPNEKEITYDNFKTFAESCD